MPLTRDQVQEIKYILKTSLSEFIKDTDFKSLLIESLKDVIDQKLQEQKTEYEKKIKKLEEKIDTTEQYSRRKNIRMYGVKENLAISTEEQVHNVMEKLNIGNKKITECYRIGKINSDNNKPRAIFIKFASYEDKQGVIVNRKKLKGTKIHIKEDLTNTRLEILTSASTKYGFKNVWSQNGKIFGIVNGIKREFKKLEDISD